MGHPARIAILQFLASQECCFFGDIHEELPIAKATVSQHLKELKEAGLIQGEIEAYTRLYCNGDWSKTKKELYDYASRMATFDIDGVREYSEGYLGRYHTTFYTSGEYYQMAYANCPETTGFNVIPLNVPDAGNMVVAADFVGLGGLQSGEPRHGGAYRRH